MRRTLIVWAALLLTGCAAPFLPYTVEVRDTGAFETDLAACRSYAGAYPHPPLDLRSIGSGAALGAAENTPSGLGNPISIGVAAVAGAVASTITGLDVFAANERRIIVRCLQAKGDRSGAYLTLEPLN